ncbi:hypothetical protein GCM10027259_55290 [Micromonospora palomenae]
MIPQYGAPVTARGATCVPVVVGRAPAVAAVAAVSRTASMTAATAPSVFVDRMVSSCLFRPARRAGSSSTVGPIRHSRPTGA